jgi:toxic protein SymE
MTTDHHTQALRLPKIKAHQRRLKVREAYHSYQLNQNQRTPVGEIHLKGNWLIQAGFVIDTPVKVRVMEGCLVLTTDI